MKVGSANNNLGSGSIQMSMQQGNDSFSKDIQNQIANAQKQMQEISENKEMSVEEKMKKRQELQKQISDLENQLRQHQIEQRTQKQQKKSSSKDDMQAIISADSSVKQVKEQGAVKTEMEGTVRVLKSEIKQDEARGQDTTKKKEDLAEVETKTENIITSQMSILSSVQKNLRATSEKEQKDSISEEQDNANQKSSYDRIDDIEMKSISERYDIKADSDNSSLEEMLNETPNRVVVNLAKSVGQNVDVKL